MPDIPKNFIEFGVEDYRESNTRFLLQIKNWAGLVIDGSTDNINDIKSQSIYWRHNLTAINAFLDKDNINEVINRAGFAGEIGLLSIDIDGNDYWVWQNLSIVNPAIVVVEYNALFGDIHELTVPYDSKFDRTKAHFSNLYFGASLRALISLGSKKGYRFIGTTSTGVNAFFIRTDLAQHVEKSIQNNYAFPSSFREARCEKGVLQYPDRNKRHMIIDQLPLQNIEDGQITTLAQCKKIFSKKWGNGEKVVI